MGWLLYFSGGSGEINSFHDIEKFREETGASSVMIARQAEWNCSIFRKEGKLPLDDVIVKYIKYVSKFQISILLWKLFMDIFALKCTEQGSKLAVVSRILQL